ncbi:MAG TPA: CPBP family intramembrane glutamic endopeptidase [Thermoanaerobaculia bacterium]|nr:CPBP family intramembrane glutamic endopeptidase [Thermoanaerobaculia bacterium]
MTTDALRGFGPLGVLAMVIIMLTGNIVLPNMIVLPVGAVLVLLWARWSQTPLAAIGYARPRSWALSIAGGVALGIAFKLAMKMLVMPLLGADPVNHAYHFLAGNRALLPAAVWAMLIAGFAEETVFRGYLFERLGALLGSGAVAKTAVVLITSLWFGASHYLSQGVAGVEQATIVGLVFGAIFATTGRIWMVMCAHAAFDLTALAIIYWDVEAKVAGMLWRPM